VGGGASVSRNRDHNPDPIRDVDQFATDIEQAATDIEQAATDVEQAATDVEKIATVIGQSAAPLILALGAERPVNDLATMPDQLRAQVEDLKAWADANKRDSSRDAIAFWSLKVPAIVASATAGIWGYYQLTAVSIVFGSIASACIIIDGIHPRGTLRNIHLRAHYDLMLLTTKMLAEWRGRNPSANLNLLASKIIKDAEVERQRVGQYIRDAETALKEKADP